MADTDIPTLADLTSPATGDLSVIVDVSDTSEFSTGTVKKVALSTLVAYLIVRS